MCEQADGDFAVGAEPRTGIRGLTELDLLFLALVARTQRVSGGLHNKKCQSRLTTEFILCNCHFLTTMYEESQYMHKLQVVTGQSTECTYLPQAFKASL